MVTFTEILRALNQHGVEYVVVGGVAAVLNGAVMTTLDVDVVHRRTPDNLGRLSVALAALEAVYRMQRERRLVPDQAGLAGVGHHLLTTKYGHLDVLGAIEGGLGYDELLPRSAVLELTEDLAVRVLDLPALIALKEQSTTPKDRANLMLMRAALEARKK